MQNRKTNENGYSENTPYTTLPLTPSPGLSSFIYTPDAKQLISGSLKIPLLILLKRHTELEQLCKGSRKLVKEDLLISRESFDMLAELLILHKGHIRWQHH